MRHNRFFWELRSRGRTPQTQCPLTTSGSFLASSSLHMFLFLLESRSSTSFNKFGTSTVTQRFSCNNTPSLNALSSVHKVDTMSSNPEIVHVGIHVGSSSASVAYIISGSEPQSVLFEDHSSHPRRLRPTVPLRCSRSDSQWGYDLYSDLNSSCLFGYEMGHGYDDGRLSRILTERHGSKTYVFGDVDAKLDDWVTDNYFFATDQMTAFILKVVAYVSQYIIRSYGHGPPGVDMAICVVLPPHFTSEQLEKFKDIFHHSKRFHFGFGRHPPAFITQPRSALLYFADKNHVDLRPGNILIACHTEDQITVYATTFFTLCSQFPFVVFNYCCFSYLDGHLIHGNAVTDFDVLPNLRQKRIIS